MRKISRREAIILGVTVVVALYGVYNLLPQGSKAVSEYPSAMKAGELKGLAAEIALSLSGDILTAAESYAIIQAEKPWERDPFMERKTMQRMNAPPAASGAGATGGAGRIALRYTGYMEFLGKKMAIINGIEYMAGEALELPGYFLRSISPERVTVENELTKTRMEISIQD